MHPEMTPNWTQFGVYFGVSSSIGIIKGPNPVYLGMYRIWPRLGYGWGSRDPKWTILGPRDDTSDPALQTTRQILRQITCQIARHIQHIRYTSDPAHSARFAPEYTDHCTRAYNDLHQHQGCIKTSIKMGSPFDAVLIAPNPDPGWTGFDAGFNTAQNGPHFGPLKMAHQIRHISP